MTNFSITQRQSGSRTILDVHGRITLGESSRALLRALEDNVAAGQIHIVLDVANVSHLDSSGLGSLLVGYNSLRAQGGSIALLRAPRHIRELLELSRLTTVFRLLETEEEAVN